MHFKEVFKALENAELRAANKDHQTNEWHANPEVKEAILEAFKHSKLKSFEQENYPGHVDKDFFAPRKFSPEELIRLVPGGSSVRPGAYIAPKVVIMPPSYINVGAYVDEGTMVDSQVLVGSCAQVGKNVHLSAGVCLGGVLEPIGMRPVVIEDECFIGAGAQIVEGIIIRKRAVIAPQVSLSKGTPIFDLVNEVEIKNREIPEGAVVVSGTTNLGRSESEFSKKFGLKKYCAMIIKYRDEKSDASLELESLLR